MRIISCYRVNCLAAISLLQAWMMWNFITFHLRRRREQQDQISASQNTRKEKIGSEKKTKKPKNSPGKTNSTYIFYSLYLYMFNHVSLVNICSFYYCTTT